MLILFGRLKERLDAREPVAAGQSEGTRGEFAPQTVHRGPAATARLGQSLAWPENPIWR